MSTKTETSLPPPLDESDAAATAALSSSNRNTGDGAAAESFLALGNLCGRTLLALVGRGHSLLADVRIQSERVPGAFWAAARAASDAAGRYGPVEGAAGAKLHCAGEAEEDRRYAPFLFDFSYLHNPEEWEASLALPAAAGPGGEAGVGTGDAVDSGGADLLELEREFAVNQCSGIEACYALFHAVYNYQRDLNQFVEDLARGFYIRYTAESVLLDADGRALLCEAVWLYGVVLILMERLMPGPVRERLVIAHFRLYGRDGDHAYFDLQHDRICKLCESTGSNGPTSNGASPSVLSAEDQPRSHKPPMSEDELFARYPLPPDLVRSVIGCLTSDDIYRRSSAFPNIEHRSTRLARQASMLYVVLFFDPGALREEGARLREIVDKYFRDNWVVHVYAGMTADLSAEWARFPAARAALAAALGGNEGVRALHVRNATLISQCMAELRAYLTMGILTDGFVLDNRHDLLNTLRRCNIAVRWRILHRRTSDTAYHAIVCAETRTPATDPKLEGQFSVSGEHVVSLLLLTSQLEMLLKDRFHDLIRRKEDIWVSCRARSVAAMADLAEHFRGDRTLARAPRHDGLAGWFQSMAGEVGDLSHGDGQHVTVTGRSIQLCVQALEEVEMHDLVDRDAGAKACLKDARGMLLQMARAVGVDEGVCDDIRWISDMSYGVESMWEYVPIIHSRISKDPSNVSLLQGLFLKLSSSLDGPVERLRQLESPEAARITDYYSGQLISFVRNVLDVVPVSVFAILVQMSDIIERRLQSLPQKVQADTLSAYAQLGERYKLAMMAHEISIFANGILEMENTDVGGALVNPRKLLDEGLRKALVSHVSELLNNLLQFDFSAKSETVTHMVKHHATTMRSLMSLSGRLEGFRVALECVEDYACMQGLKMWHEELSRITEYNVEQEVNKYLLKKVLDADSKFQSKIVPIPHFPRTRNEPSCITFMGRIVSMLIKITDAQYTTYSIERSGWFMSDESEVCGLKTISLVRRAIGVYGLTGVDRLLCYRILHELHRLVKFFRTNVSKQGVLLEQLRDELFPEWKIPKDAVAIYALGSKKTEMLMLPMLTCFRRVGQAQLLRRMIRFELQRCARVDAKMLQHTVMTLNASLLTEQQLPKDDPDDIKNICDMTVAVGGGDPLGTIFMKADPLEGLPVLLLFFVITYVPRLSYNPACAALSKVKEGYPIDGWPIVAGISTLLKQFNPSYTKSFLAYVGQFVRVSVQAYAERKIGGLSNSTQNEATRLAADLKNSMVLLEQFCDISGLPSSAVYEHVPKYVIEMCSDLPLDSASSEASPDNIAKVISRALSPGS